jgi:hypothetical protein
MARDCPDRQKGASWRNDGPPQRPAAGQIGGGDAVDREYEVCRLSILNNYGAPFTNISVATYARTQWWIWRRSCSY